MGVSAIAQWGDPLEKLPPSEEADSPQWSGQESTGAKKALGPNVGCSLQK